MAPGRGPGVAGRDRRAGRPAGLQPRHRGHVLRRDEPVRRSPHDRAPSAGRAAPGVPAAVLVRWPRRVRRFRGRAGRRQAGPLRGRLRAAVSAASAVAETPPSAAPSPSCLRAGPPDYTWAAATNGADSAASMELATGGVPVMAIGGFRGTDPAPSLAQFEKLVSEHKIHYYVAGGGLGGRGGSAARARGLGGGLAERGAGGAGGDPAGRGAGWLWRLRRLRWCWRPWWQLDRRGADQRVGPGPLHGADRGWHDRLQPHRPGRELVTEWEPRSADAWSGIPGLCGIAARAPGQLVSLWAPRCQASTWCSMPRTAAFSAYPRMPSSTIPAHSPVRS